MTEFQINGNVLTDCVSDEETVMVPEGIVTIASFAFYNCQTVKEMKLPSSVHKVGNWSFLRCVNLEKINIPNSVTFIGLGAFKDCTSLKTIRIPNSVTFLGPSAFENCTALKEVTMSTGVAIIERLTFANCSSLEKIKIPKGKAVSIGGSTFYKCSNLKKLNISNNVYFFGYSTFAGCKNLKSKFGLYKATDGDMKCKDYQFTLGEWSMSEENIQLCKQGYHYVTNLFDVFNYYAGELGKDIRIFEVETRGDLEEVSKNDSKRVCSSIKLVRELSREEIIKILNDGGRDK